MDDLLVTDVGARGRGFAVSVDFAEISAFYAVEPDGKFAGREVLLLLHVDDARYDLARDKPDVVARQLDEDLPSVEGLDLTVHVNTHLIRFN